MDFQYDRPFIQFMSGRLLFYGNLCDRVQQFAKLRSERVVLVVKQPLKIQLPQQAIEEFCDRWKIQELYLFGSVLREDFRADSDIDVMVRFEDSAPWRLLEFVRMKRELELICEEILKAAQADANQILSSV